MVQKTENIFFKLLLKSIKNNPNVTKNNKLNRVMKLKIIAVCIIFELQNNANNKIIMIFIIISYTY